MADRINSKKKGNRLELAVTQFMKEWTGYEFSRVPQSGGLRWQNRTSIAGDVICTDKKHERNCRISIEVKAPKEIAFEHLLLPTKGKNTDKLNHYWDQCTSDAKAVKKVPMLFIHRNGMAKGIFFVVMNNEVYNEIARELNFYPVLYGCISYLSQYRGIVILNSEDLKQINYKDLHKKVFKPYCKIIYKTE